MTAVIVALQRATSDLPEVPTTPGRPRDVQVAPQPLMAPGSPLSHLGLGYVTVLLRYESTLMSSLHLYMLQSWERRPTPGKLVLSFSMVAKTALTALIFSCRPSYEYSVSLRRKLKLSRSRCCLCVNFKILHPHQPTPPHLATQGCGRPFPCGRRGHPRAWDCRLQKVLRPWSHLSCFSPS